ncbi:hypothetical protein F2Q69_00050858 [Brassica cretica]|uniref:Uncharacterized protein n=1 Tax=Brassica cretica TaxID=69181 RepID=A0A8S9PUT4_BRACR|nr:hypothetical protein F2Q69_00050858 [Brassica cretica]
MDGQIFLPPSKRWSKPPSGWIKCDVAASRTNGISNSGGAWVARDSAGVVNFHSRRSFFRVEHSLLPDLSCLLWLQGMEIGTCGTGQKQSSFLDCYYRYQSYVATGGPSWLQGLLNQEAVNSNH